MLNPIKDVTSLIGTAGKTVDDNFESGEERQAQLTKRLEIDMASDNTLSKMIRPITLIYLGILEGIIVITASFGVKIDLAIVTQVGLLFGSAVAFYFSSKKAERIADKNASANLEIEKMKTKAEIKERRRENRRNK